MQDETAGGGQLAALMREREDELLEHWVASQMAAVTLRPDLLSASELREQSRELLHAFTRAAQSGLRQTDVLASQWEDVRSVLAEVSRTRAGLGFTTTETATFVLSLKEPLFTLFSAQDDLDAGLLREIWDANIVLDRLGLYTTEQIIALREATIGRQERELTELSTPVIQLWEGVLALPLIGTLDSGRAQTVMEGLLERLAATGSTVAIIDITGVPTVDTLVAQNLLRTTAAARLMGAECIISGIRPQIAQTMVQLGVSLGDVESRASMADAIALALDRRGFAVTRQGDRT